MATPTVERVAYRINEVAAALGISRAQVYNLMDQGELRYKQVTPNGARLIPAAELQRLMAINDDEDDRPTGAK